MRCREWERKERERVRKGRGGKGREGDERNMEERKGKNITEGSEERRKDAKSGSNDQLSAIRRLSTGNIFFKT
jgi:hypothetical protein